MTTTVSVGEEKAMTAIDLVPVHPGHSHIRQQNIESFGFAKRYCLGSARGDANFVARPAEGRDDVDALAGAREEDGGPGLDRGIYPQARGR